MKYSKMKNLFFFIVVVFLFFSCAGTPEPGEELPEETEFEEVLEELEITDDNELENIDNALVFEEILEREADDFVNDVFDDGIEDDTEDDTGVEFSSEEDAVVIEERLSSIEESLSNIEERLALIADALINAQATPLPETTVPVVEVPAPTAPVVPPAPVEAVQPQEPMPSVAQPPDDDSAPSEPPPTREPVREAPPLVSVLRDFPPVPALPAISPREDEVVFSRIVRATVGQMIEIPFRGTNWVYLGELASRRGVELNSSRREPEGQSFVFRAESEGAYVLKFFREDFLRGYIINDHVQVIVGEAAVTGTGWFNPPFDRGRVVAEPRWPSALEEAQIQRGTSRTPASSLTSEPDKSGKDSLSAIPSAPSTGVEGNIRANETESRQTGQSIAAVPQDMPSSAGAQGSLIPSEQFPLEQAPLEHAQEQALSEQVLFEQTQLEQLPPEVLLQRARESFDGGNVAAAIALLDQVNAHYPSGIDELYWLYGQFYEANSPSRNILLSLDYYRRLVDEFPQSSRFNDARRRIAYLERFYINIQ